MTQITKWSYSTWKLYKQCPLRVRLSKIEKIPEGERSPALERGNDIHAKCENYIRDPKSLLPIECSKFSHDFLRMREMGKRVLPEEEWAFDVRWNRVDWKAKDAWVRMKIDVHYLLRDLLTLTDYKTGKVYEDNRSQLSLYSLGSFKVYPKIKLIKSALWHLDVGPAANITEDFIREEEPAMQEAWNEAVDPLLSDTIFAPRPGWYCSGCPYAKKKGGPCEYGA